VIRARRDARRAEDDLDIYLAVVDGISTAGDIRRHVGIRSTRVYAALGRLVDRGWIEGAFEDDGSMWARQRYTAVRR
jgi:DNA-binding MarR family transcriptional regulator